jgi:F-type H+-transporting ATPase subunit a
VKTVYIVGAFVAVGVWLAIGLLVARGPQPEIIVPAETITTVGPLNITNTLITAWVVMAFLAVFTFAATRSMSLLPGGFQNFVEGVIDFLLGQVEEIAGRENGRRFFMVVATLFIFIIVSNWAGLLPFFNAIGKTEDVGHEIFHEIEEHHAHHKVFEDRETFASFLVNDTSGMGLVKPGNTDRFEFDIPAGASPEEALDLYIVALAEQFTDFEANLAPREIPSAAVVQAARAALEAEPGAPVLLHGDAEHGVLSPGLGEYIGGVEFPGQKLALIIPFFRSVYSDVNNTLALGIIAFLFIEFWGLQSLGIGYLGKFFNFRNPINAFVGFLELLSEFIRIISFTFRLFGNIFAGEVLILMLTFLMPFLFVDVIYGLELFVGFIQAAVFALLTLVFATMAVEAHGDGEHGEHHEVHTGEADPHHTPGAAQAH